MDRAVSRSTRAVASRRVALQAGAGALLVTVGLAHAHAGLAQGSTPATPVPFEGDAYVGVTDMPDLFAAVVIGAEEARGYLCDGSSLITWFTGPATTPLALASEAGDAMSLASEGEVMAGSVTLADGSLVSFTAAPATGIGGLYEVVVEGMRAAGAAAGGLRLEAVVAGTLPDGMLLLAGAVALPEGGLRPLAVFASPDAAGVQRWIVLGDGRVTGGFKKGSGTGIADGTSNTVVPRDTPFIDPTSDL
jgi:hypothetical protein